MPTLPSPHTHPDDTQIYEIRLEGHLGSQWAGRFGALTIQLVQNGETLLAGPVADQAALHGVLKKIRDLGMPLISVVRRRPARQAATSLIPPTANPE